VSAHIQKRVARGRRTLHLLPWEDVARRYTLNTGQPMSAKLAEYHGAKALAKLLDAMRAAGIESPEDVNVKEVAA
jgi:hypothetical protein